MAEEKSVRDDPIVLRFRGAFDGMKMLDAIRKFYKSVKIDCKEDKLKLKGKEIEFKFRGDRKTTEMTKVFLYTEGKVWVLGSKDIMQDGQKVSLPYGKVELKIKGTFSNDFSDSVEKTGKFSKSLEKNLFHPETGLAYGDVKMAGEKFMEKTLGSYTEYLKKFFKMECQS